MRPTVSIAGRRGTAPGHAGHCVRWRSKEGHLARVVVIATAQLERQALSAVLEPDDELHVLVPAVEQSRLDWLTNDEGEARDEGERVGRQIGRDAPTEADTVDVRPDSPSQLVRDAIAEHDPDRIVVAVREGEDASWLEVDELGELPAQIDGVPVTKIALTEESEAPEA